MRLFGTRIRRGRSARSGVVVIATVGLGLVSFAPAANAATKPLAWTPVASATTSELLPQGTSCVGFTTPVCVAVGFGGSNAFVETNRSGTWSRDASGTPSPSAYYASSLDSVSCVSTNFCMAVGSDQPLTASNTENPLVAQFDGTSWSFQELSAPAVAGYILDAISCPTAQVCVAVGRGSSGAGQALIERWAAGVWTATLLPTPTVPQGDSGLKGIACSSIKSCLAVGFYGTDANFDLQSYAFSYAKKTGWTAAPPPLLAGSNMFDGVSCRGTTCVVVGDQAGQSETLIETYSAGQWAIDSATPLPGGLHSLACVTLAKCVAAGTNASRQPILMASTNGVWAPATATSPLGSTYEFAGVSCASASYCVAAGYGVPTSNSLLTGFIDSGKA